MSFSYFKGLLAGAALAAAATGAHAAERTFVASFGDDANPCSLASPCRSFTRALTQTTSGGEVLVLDSAGYGPFVITQSVSILAPEGIYAGIAVPAGQDGIVVNGAGIKVTLRGLTINGQGGDDGIVIQNAGDVYIEKVAIANTGNDVADSGVRVAAAGSRVFVTDTSVRGTAGRGIRVEADATVVVDRSRIEANGSRGINGCSTGGRLTVSDSVVARNTFGGVGVATSAAGAWDVTVANSTVEDNVIGTGVLVGGGTGGAYRVAVTDSVLRGNGSGVDLSANTGETMTGTVGNNQVLGNAGTAVICQGTGTATLIAQRNEVVGNLQGFAQGGNCILMSMGSNAVESNTNPDSGTISPGAPR